MNKKNILTISLLIISIVVLFITFENEINALWQKQTKVEYPLAKVDFVSEVKQSSGLNGISTGNTYLQNQLSQITNSIPSSAPIYEYVPSKLSTRQGETELISAFGLGDATKTERTDNIIGRSISIITADKNLDVYPDLGYLSLTQGTNSSNLSNIPLSFDINQYEKIAYDYAVSIGLDIENFEYSGYKFYSASENEMDEASSISSAKLVEISYEAKINNYPIMENSYESTANFLRIWLNSNLQIVKVDYKPIGTIGQKVGTYNLKSLSDITSEVNSGKAKFVSTKLLPGQNIVSTTVQNAKLGYYSINGYLVPVYILEGMSNSVDGDIAKSYLILEAVKK